VTRSLIEEQIGWSGVIDWRISKNWVGIFQGGKNQSVFTCLTPVVLTRSRIGEQIRWAAVTFNFPFSEDMVFVPNSFFVCHQFEKPAKIMAKIELCVEDKVRGQARVRTIDKLDEVCTNADDRMMLVRHRSGDCVMS